MRKLSPSFIGLDVGTSGCRAVALDESGRECAAARVSIPPPSRLAEGGVEQAPELWWHAVRAVLEALGGKLRDRPPAAICVDATSATLLLATLRGPTPRPGMDVQRLSRRRRRGSDRACRAGG